MIRTWCSLVLAGCFAGVARSDGPARRIHPESPIPPRVKLTHHTEKKADWVPDYSRVATVEITRGGRWSEIFRSLPLQTDDVVRVAKNVTVEFDAAETPPLRALVLEGTLKFAPDRNTQLTVGTLQIPTGKLIIKPTTGTAEIQFFGDLDRVNDPGQYSVGLLALGGEVEIGGPTPTVVYSRLAHPTSPGATTVELSDSVTWQPGDRVLVSGASLVKTGSSVNELALESEFAEVAKTQGSQITLKSPLQFAHQDGVSHLSRRVHFTTATHSPVLGHLWFSHLAKVSFDGASLDRLGRTLTSRLNDTRWQPDGTAAATGTQQRGRYILHAHHLVNPIRIANCVILDRPTNRWAITLHASHGEIERNIIVFPGGAGIVAENGFETGSIRNNVLIGGLGGGDYYTDPDRGSLRGIDGANLEDRGWEGYGLWLRSPTFRVTGNITEGAFREAAFGFHFFEPDGNRDATTFPQDPGRPTQVAGKSLGDVWCRLSGFQKFTDNTNYAFIAREPSGGGALYLAHMFLNSPFTTDRFTSRNSGKILAYYSRTLEFSGLDLVGNADRGGISPGFFFFGIENVTLKDSTIRNCTVGLTPPLIALTVTNCLFDNDINFAFQPGDADCTCHTSRYGRTHTLTHVRFGEKSGTNIWMQSKEVVSLKEQDAAGHPNGKALARLFARQTRVVVQAYNGKSGDDFEVFYPEQAADYVLPGLGVSNQDLFAGKASGEISSQLRGRSFNDRIVREPKTREGIVGLVGPIDTNALVYTDWLGNEQMESEAGSQSLRYNLGGRLISSTEIAGGKNFEEKVEVKPGLNFLTRTIPGVGPYTFMIYGRGK